MNLQTPTKKDLLSTTIYNVLQFASLASPTRYLFKITENTDIKKLTNIP